MIHTCTDIVKFATMLETASWGLVAHTGNNTQHTDNTHNAYNRFNIWYPKLNSCMNTLPFELKSVTCKYPVLQCYM